MNETGNGKLLTFEEQAEALMASTDQIMKAFWDNDRHRQTEAIHSALSRLYQMICIVRRERLDLAIEGERETCAKIAKNVLDERSFGPDARIGSIVAEAIRARLEPKEKKADPACSLCACGHPLAVHRRGVGRCLMMTEAGSYCDCLKFQDGKEEIN